MNRKNKFPVEQNYTKLPPDFRCYGVDLQKNHFSGLQSLSSIIAVESPAGYNIRRGGKTEDEHLDLFFVQTGKFVIETENSIMTACGGQVMIVPSWIDREIFIPEESDHVYVRFDNPKKFFPITQVSVRNSRNVDAVAFYTKPLLENSEFPDEPLYRSHLAECLTILFQRELFATDVQKAPPEKTQALLSQLQTADSESLSVKSACKQFGMSFSSFRKFCLENFGKAPSDLINDIRISRARALLSYSNLSIDDIAAQLGYSDRFSFSKAFTRLTSQSPASFRKCKK